MSPQRLHPETSRWVVSLALVFMAGMAMVLFAMLTLATSDPSLYEGRYSLLLGINLAIAAVLFLAIGWLSFRLAGRLRERRFGSRLLLKLAAIFALVGFVPGLLIYVVSYQFVSRSIESWFDVRVETALKSGLNLGRSTLDTLAADLSTKVRTAAVGLSSGSDAAISVSLDRLREQWRAEEVVLWSPDGQPIASAGGARYDLRPDRPTSALLRQVREQRVLTRIDGIEELELLNDPTELRSTPAERLPRIRVWALVSPNRFDLGGQARYLQVGVPLPAVLLADALAVQVAHREYQERALARDGLRGMYIGTLTLALFLAVFGAVLLAVLLGNQLVRPLLVLAEGMRDVARGDLTPKIALPNRDELAGLTRTFAHMTQELSDARQAVQHSMAQVDAARSNLQTLLDNLTAGVMVLDHDQRILSANPGAARILHHPLAEHVGQGLSQMPGLADWAQVVARQFERFQADVQGHREGHWQETVELRLSTDPARSSTPLSLIVRGAWLPNGDRLLVFDDVSGIISAQRAQAWGEVARRLAHEIKNPLTPIQLSAERLEMKLAPRLDGSELAVLHKSVRTIVDQVEAMKRLVNEFRDYARLPSAQLVPVDLNALVTDIVALYEAAEPGVQLRLDPACPPVSADPQQVRQVLINLVQNALDATPAGGPPVEICTRPSATAGWVRLLVLDSGSGFSEDILRRAFEPYVTTKSKGTGLGLAVVKKIMDEHGGRVDLDHRRYNGHIIGAQVSLSFKVANAQQS